MRRGEVGNLKHWIFPFVIVLAFLFFFFSPLTRHLTLSSLKMYELDLTRLVAEHWLLAPLLYMALYALAVALLLPIGVYLSLAAGFLFPQPLSVLYILVGYTLGCCVGYLSAQDSVHTLFLKFAGPRLRAIEKAFQANEVNYLLCLRLIPLSPTGIVNLAAVFFEVHLWTFIWTAFVGTIPSAAVFSEIGGQLSKLLIPGQEYSIYSIFNWRVNVALITLSIISLLPVFIKRARKG
jgi:uncharacterized membrane protein YdjX (TVP38/TMEM64 family)